MHCGMRRSEPLRPFSQRQGSWTSYRGMNTKLTQDQSRQAAPPSHVEPHRLMWLELLQLALLQSLPTVWLLSTRVAVNVCPLCWLWIWCSWMRFVFQIHRLAACPKVVHQFVVTILRAADEHAAARVLTFRSGSLRLWVARRAVQRVPKAKDTYQFRICLRLTTV